MKTIIDFANKVRSLADGRISNIANVEGATSAHPYTVGKQLIFNGLLCKATSAIAVGDTLAVGTNLALSDNVVEQIYSLNQGLTNSLANISHENLLDNPWFTVNQRGVSSFGGDTSRHYGPDRWQIAYNPSSNTINVTSDGLQIAPTTSPIILWQKWDEGDFKELIGKCITTSVMTSDGTIYSGSAIFPQKGDSDTVSIRLADTDNTFDAYYQYSNNSGNIPAFGINVKPGKSVTIKAVKLELGSISTLAMDTAPNYATELLKCQRYFENDIIYFNYINGQTIIDNSVAFKVPKRTTPIMTVYSNDGTSGNCSVWNGSAFVDKAIDDAYVLNNSTVRVRVSGLSNDFIQYRLQASADL